MKKKSGLKKLSLFDYVNSVLLIAIGIMWIAIIPLFKLLKKK